MKRQSESSDSRTRVVSAVELMAGSTRAKARAVQARVFVIFMGILTCSIRERQRKGKSPELTQVWRADFQWEGGRCFDLSLALRMGHLSFYEHANGQPLSFPFLRMPDEFTIGGNASRLGCCLCDSPL